MYKFMPTRSRCDATGFSDNSKPDLLLALKLPEALYKIDDFIS